MGRESRRVAQRARIGDNGRRMTLVERIRRRLAALDWPTLEAGLDGDGYARIPGLLTAAECRSLAGLYSAETRFRTTISLERHGFGQGEYKYFSYPLPPLVAVLRESLYPQLAAIANRWLALRRVSSPQPFSRSLRGFLGRCRAEGQTRPTPLLLRYTAGGYNRLHQDLYGAVAFPLQVACLLSRHGDDFTGGEFLLLEQRARMQSRGEAVALRAGEGIVFPTRERPVASVRGFSTAHMRHGVSRVHTGERTTLGLIFHDAR
jgi:hypothetical protein